MKLLGFDYGASNGRGMLGEFDGERLALTEIHRFDNSPVWMGRHLRWDFPRLFHELKTGMRKAVGKGSPGGIESVGVNTWGVDFGLIDEYGELAYIPFHYRDELTEGAMEALRAVVPDDELYRRTGIQFMRFNTIYQLFSLNRHYPSALSHAKKLLFLPDLFGYFLTGEMTAEYSIASTTAMLDVKRRNWDTELLDRIGVDAGVLPAISMPGVPLGAILPQVADETGTGRIQAISVCGHDTAGAVLASPLTAGNPGAYLSCGTWSLLGVELDEPLTHDSAYAAQYTNEGGYGGTIRFLKNIMGQWMVNEIKREYEIEYGPVDFPAMDAMERQAPAFVSFVDVDAPEFAQPGRMADKIYAYCDRTGQRRPDGLGALVRCVNESIALSYRVNIDALENILGYRLPELRAVGGGIKNRSLMAMAASALGRPVHAGPVEASAIGNILAQLLALGEINDRWEARRIVADSFNEQIYEPLLPEASAWDEALGRYRKIKLMTG